MIYGERIVLRASVRDDLPLFVTWLNDPDVRYFLGPDEPMSVEKEERWFEQVTRNDNLHEVNYSIEYQGQLIGSCGLSEIDHRNRSAELGIMVGAKALWNQGLGTDAVRTLVRHGFETVNLHRITLRTNADNARAIRCYEKVGFRHEGRSREAAYRRGCYLDEVRMAILEGDWRAAQEMPR